MTAIDFGSSRAWKDLRPSFHAPIIAADPFPAAIILRWHYNTTNHHNTLMSGSYRKALALSAHRQSHSVSFLICQQVSYPASQLAPGEMADGWLAGWLDG